MPQPKGTGKRPGFHQNTHAFKHNKGSKKTQKILRTPNRGLCQKCHDIIEWKKQYRKYKPLVQPRKCNKCDQKNITLAYHVVCDPCAIQHKICAKCQTKDEGGGLVDQQIKRMEDKKEVLKLAEQLAALPLRKQKTILREIDQTEYLQRKERRRMRGEASDSEGEDDDEEEDNEEEEDVDDDDREEQQEETEKDNEAEDDDDEEEGEDQEDDDEEEDEEEEEEEEEGNDDNDDEFEEIEEVDEDESLMEGKIVMKKVLVRKNK